MIRKPNGFRLRTIWLRPEDGRFGTVLARLKPAIQSSEPQDVKGRVSVHVHIRLHGAVPGGQPGGSGFLVNGLLSGLNDEDRRSIIRRIVTDYLLVGLGSLAVGHFVLSLFLGFRSRSSNWAEDC